MQHLGSINEDYHQLHIPITAKKSTNIYLPPYLSKYRKILQLFSSLRFKYQISIEYICNWSYPRNHCNCRYKGILVFVYAPNASENSITQKKKKLFKINNQQIRVAELVLILKILVDSTTLKEVAGAILVFGTLKPSNFQEAYEIHLKHLGTFW